MLDTPRTVREVTERIRDLFDSDPLLGDVWIMGEVLEASLSRSGHCFFTLAGDDAQIRCVMFRMNVLRQQSLPSPGAVCVAHGKVEVYPSEGTYQFYVDLVQEAGIGLAALELELLRQQLEAEGLFSETRKRPIPANPSKIGIITSASGAVWHDIQNVVRRRYPFARLLLSPAAVQGDGAPADMIAALQSLVNHEIPDVIIIARGGGSASDLSAFNDENLVRAIFTAPVPVISAVGHETDWTLADLVADLRAPTPSAAAELVTPSISSDLSSLVESLSHYIDRFERDLTARFVDIDRLRTRLEQRGTQERRQTLLRLQRQLLKSFAAHHQTSVERSSRFAVLLEALSPAKTMERGYAFVENSASGRPVRLASQVSHGDTLRTRFIDGAIESVVTTS
jgi:exodeoxyribonuclease VII large subunit